MGPNPRKRRVLEEKADGLQKLLREESEGVMIKKPHNADATSVVPLACRFFHSASLLLPSFARTQSRAGMLPVEWVNVAKL